MSLCNYVKTNSHFKATGLELRNFGQYFILVYIEKTLNENMLHSCVNYEYLLKYVFVLYEATFFYQHSYALLDRSFVCAHCH